MSTKSWALYPLITPMFGTIPVLVSLNAAGVARGAVLIAPKDGTLDRFFLYVNGITAPPTYRLSLYTVSTSLKPTQVLLGTNSECLLTPSSYLYQRVNLTTPVAVTKGQRLAAVVSYDSGTIDATHFAQIYGNALVNAAMNNPFLVSGVPSFVTATAYPTWVTNPLNGLSCFGPLYDDDSFCIGALEVASSGITSTVWHGNRFVPEINAVCSGLWFYGRVDNATLSIWEDGVLKLTQNVSGHNVTGQNTILLDNDVNLLCGKTYHFAFFKLSGTVSINAATSQYSYGLYDVFEHSPLGMTSSDGVSWSAISSNKWALTMVPLIRTNVGPGQMINHSPMIGTM